ncbi:MAG: YiiX/YebB-like N1pC/P60 family cysteine hydrolase, partial [Bacteriovoracia bacterium]
MRFLVVLILMFSALNQALAASLRAGDVILQPLRCYSCSLIEQQEGSDYAHMGLVVKGGNNPLIAESLGQVRVVSLAEFLAKGDPSRAHKILRPRERTTFRLLEAIAPWLGAEFDRAFRWDNLGRDGREAFYCSELVTKLLNQFLETPMRPKPMDYSENFAGWSAYFNGDVPQGEPGISPADYERSDLFKPLGTIKGNAWTWH